MSLCYFFLVKKKNPSTIERIQVPCLSLRFAGADLAEIDEVGLDQFIRQKILECLSKDIVLGNPIRLPKPLTAYEHLARDKHDIHSYVLVDTENKLKKGFFAKFLPILGGASSLVSIFCHNIISMVSMQVAAASLPNQDARNTLSIAESLLASVFNLIIYFNSPANNALAQFGAKLDNFSFRKQNQVIEKPQRSCCSSTKIMLSNFGLGFLVATYIGDGANTYFQQLDGLGEKARAANSFVDPDLFDVVKWVAVITGSLALLSFYFTFIQNAAGQVDKYFTNPTTQDDEAKEVGEEDVLVEVELDTKKLLSSSSMSKSGL